jgi:hypothetical protein
MLSRYTTRLLFLLFLLSSSLGLNALRIEPLRTIISTEAGIENKGSITLTNEKKIPVSVEIELLDISKQKGLVEHDWLKFGHSLLELEPGEQIQLGYSIFLPGGSSGEYPARIAFTERAAGAIDTEMVTINTRVSVPFYATIRGTEIYDIQIDEFYFNGDSRREATVVVQNSGNVHVRPVGRCVVKSEEVDGLMQSVAINGGGYPILPKSKEKFKVRFSKAFPVGAYVAQLEFRPFEGREENVSRTFNIDFEGIDVAVDQQTPAPI